jgi:predicted transposase YdaD
VLLYILDRGELSDKETFIDLVMTKLPAEVGEEIMTIAEQFKAEGAEKAQSEIAERLLSRNESLSTIAELTGLSLEKIKKLKQDMH